MASPTYAITANSLTAETFRQAPASHISGTGVVGSGDLAVAAHGTPNMSIDVAAGQVWVPGTLSSTTGFPTNVNAQTTYGLPSAFNQQSSYFQWYNATTNLAIAAADLTNPRIDLAVVSIQDAQYSGSNNQGILQIITGTPAASPSPPNAPASSVVLAQIAVAAGASSIVTANITDKRPFLQMVYAQQRNIYQTSVHATSASTLTNNAYSVVTFNVVDYDPSSAWNTGTNTWTAPIAGRYQISARVSLSATCTDFAIAVFQNGAQTRNGQADYKASAIANSSSVTAVLTCAVGDTIKIEAYQNTGGAANNVADALDTYLDIVRIGAQ